MAPPSITGEKAVFVNFFTNEGNHTVIGFHYIIHVEALCAKAGLKVIQEVMQIVTNVVNCIYALALHKNNFRFY